MGSYSDVTLKMKADWNRRAEENARFYVQTEQQDWDDRGFFRTGEINVANDIMPDMARICGGARSPRDLTVLEIGCGVGRMTRMLAALFGKVIAVDVSERMIEYARRNLLDFKNVRFLATDGGSLSSVDDASVDFAFSFIVFQHIPEKGPICSYFNEVYRVLKPNSIFKVQLSGATFERESGDTLDTWEGVSFTEEEAATLVHDAGFHLEYSSGAGSQYFWLCLRKP